MLCRVSPFCVGYVVDAKCCSTIVSLKGATAVYPGI